MRCVTRRGVIMMCEAGASCLLSNASRYFHPNRDEHSVQ
jgi:hypothetical protein